MKLPLGRLELDALLEHEESHWLDFRSELDPGLERSQPGKDGKVASEQACSRTACTSVVWTSAAWTA